MPRIITSHGDLLDFCRYCYPSPGGAYTTYAFLGDGHNGRGNCYEYDADHPDYVDEVYRCIHCEAFLTEEDI